ncbi:cytochrome c-type biogenesis protein CcsB [Frankineae bacterium MT45]|nr:cytochrome c-type biogenesis protein CcsB [Frankineae bacterium MT45]
MAVNEHYASLSNVLFTTAIATYSVAMILYAAEYAFGRRGRVASTTPAASRSLVGAAGSGADANGAGSGGRGISVVVPPENSITASGVRHGSAGDRFGQLAVLVTVLGALLHGASVTLRGVAADRIPWGNMYEFATLVGLIAVLAFLVVLARAPQIRYLGLFVMLPVILVMFLAGTVWYAKDAPLVPALQSYWLAIHVTLAATSEGILLTSAVLTGLFLIRNRYDKLAAAHALTDSTEPMKVRFPVSLGARMPAPETLDRVAYRTVAFAFPLYTCGVIAGAIWAEAAWGRYWGWDPKETWAFIAWVIYACYLHARATAGWKGSRAAWINLLGFGAMTFNFFVVNVVISGLHSYAGLN